MKPRLELDESVWGDKATLNIVSKGNNARQIGIRFSHFARKIEPVDGAPAAGVISDFSKGQYVYKLISADETVRNWTLNISVAP